MSEDMPDIISDYMSECMSDRNIISALRNIKALIYSRKPSGTYVYPSERMQEIMSEYTSEYYSEYWSDWLLDR